MKNHIICPSWLSFGLVNSIRGIIQNPYAMLKDYIRPGSTAADIGCGPGYFSIPMAYMAGPNGTVIAVDLQSRMIDRLKKTAEKRGLADRFRTVVCRNDDLCIQGKADFVLTFWMVHEVRNVPLFFRQIAGLLNDNGRYLLAEPRIHVGKREYAETLKKAEQNGLKAEKEVKIFFSRATVFTRQ
ncbi:MAG: class I SAM-dependent methyltransferase [Chitinispirillaceae bacterium]|nr:class I SAM-dependent methyltransferase [Chitinispirillaceae bacterium]